MLDEIGNERIGGMTKLGEISGKVQEKRLRWFGHVMRRKEDRVGKRVMALEVQGMRKRGRPKQRWTQNEGHEREGRTARADAGPSCAEATRPIHRPHMKRDKMWEKKPVTRPDLVTPPDPVTRSRPVCERRAEVAPLYVAFERQESLTRQVEDRRLRAGRRLNRGRHVCEQVGNARRRQAGWSLPRLSAQQRVSRHVIGTAKRHFTTTRHWTRHWTRHLTRHLTAHSNASVDTSSAQKNVISQQHVIGHVIGHVI